MQITGSVLNEIAQLCPDFGYLLNLTLNAIELFVECQGGL